MRVSNSKWKYDKLAVVVCVPQATQNFVISLSCFVEDGKECTKIYDARAQLLFCSLNLLFGDFIAVVVVCLSSLFLICHHVSLKPDAVVLKRLRAV